MKLSKGLIFALAALITTGALHGCKKDNGLDENTIVIFTSDNGPWLSYGNHGGCTLGLREGKGTTFDGGQRVPMIMRMPGTIPAGKVSDQFSSALDITPTLVALTGAEMPFSERLQVIWMGKNAPLSWPGFMPLTNGPDDSRLTRLFSTWLTRHFFVNTAFPYKNICICTSKAISRVL